jgi:divalent metal cation (Fe/Co/Zn/Cd) transporter
VTPSSAWPETPESLARSLGSSAAPAPRPDRATVERLARRARILSWLSLVWMTVEGTVAILAGAAAGSIALIGFGLDSAVEGLASVIIIWRFTGHRIHSAAAEARSQKLVAVQFFLLAPYVAVESARALIGGERPDETLVGILLACGSVVFMPILGIAKQRIADRLGSAATRGEGRQNMLCAYLAGALLVGLLGNAWLAAWWLDATVGLLIAGVAVKEGREAWRGEGCCVSAPPGLDVATDRCADDRCVAEPATHDDCCSMSTVALTRERTAKPPP